MVGDRDQLAEKISAGDIDTSELAQYVGQCYVLDRAIAAFTGVPPKILLTLSKSLDSITRQNVIRNEATPADVLISLAAEFPREFFNHPLLGLLILEDPRLLHKLEPGVLKSFLNSPECPESFLLWACRHGYKTDQMEILKRSDLKVEWLQLIARGAHPKPAERAMDHLVEMGKSW